MLQYISKIKIRIQFDPRTPFLKNYLTDIPTQFVNWNVYKANNKGVETINILQ